MAENTTVKFNTRLGLKVDTLANWNSSTIGLLKGEIAIATVAAGAGTGLSEPVCMIKIGEDGVKTFSQLDFQLHAKASDVLAACKTEDGLTAFITNVINNSGLATDDAMTELTGRVTTAEGKLATLEGDGEGSVAKAISDAIAALDLPNTYATKTEAQGYANAKDEAIAAAKKAGDDAQADVDDLGELVGALPEGATATTVVGYVDEKVAAASGTLNGTISGIDGRLTTAEGKITNLETESAKHAIKTEVDAALDLKADKSALKTTDDTLAEVKATVDNFFAEDAAVNDTIDTLKEIANYIANDKEGAADITARVGALEGKVDVDKVSEAIDADVKVEKERAEAAESKLSGRLDTLEAIDHEAYIGADTALKNELQGKIDAIDNHSHGNKTVLDGITAEKVSAWDAAEQNAKDYADDLTKIGDDITYVSVAGGNVTLHAASSVVIGAGDYAGVGFRAKPDGTISVTGDMQLPAGDPQTDNSATNKKYVDDAVAAVSSELNDVVAPVANSALQNVEAGYGIKVTTKADNKQTISLDDTITYVFNCGTASEVI